MKSFEKYIKRYSSSFTYVKNGNTITVKGIIQPLHYSDKSYFSSKRFPAGVFDGRHYFLITTPEYKSRLFNGLVIDGENTKYRVKSVESYRVKNNDIYVWAVLTVHTDSTGGVYE